MSPDARLLIGVSLLVLFLGAFAWAWWEADKAEREDGIGL